LNLVLVLSLSSLFSKSWNYLLEWMTLIFWFSSGMYKLFSFSFLDFLDFANVFELLLLLVLLIVLYEDLDFTDLLIIGGSGS